MTQNRDGYAVINKALLKETMQRQNKSRQDLENLAEALVGESNEWETVSIDAIKRWANSNHSQKTAKIRKIHTIEKALGLDQDALIIAAPPPFEESKASPEAQQQNSSDASFFSEIKQRIAAQLNHDDHAILCRNLDCPNPLPASPICGDIAVNCLIPNESVIADGKAINTLHIATEKALIELTVYPSDQRKQIANYAIDILGWLLILVVNEEWLARNKDISEMLLRAERVHIPVDGETGMEIVVSRLRDTQAKFALSPDQADIVRKHRLELSRLERGLTEDDQVIQLEAELWRILYKRKSPKRFGESERTRMKNLLEVRGQHNRERYDIALRVERRGESDQSLAILKTLRERYPALTVITIGVDVDDSVFVMKEGKLHESIYDFLNMIGQYA